MVTTYKLPACWLGQPKTEIHVIRKKGGGKALKEVITAHIQDDIQPGCKCKDPRQAFMCMEGHLAECHVGMTCEEARCSHYLKNQGGIT